MLTVYTHEAVPLQRLLCQVQLIATVTYVLYKKFEKKKLEKLHPKKTRRVWILLVITESPSYLRIKVWLLCPRWKLGWYCGVGFFIEWLEALAFTFHRHCFGVTKTSRTKAWHQSWNWCYASGLRLKTSNAFFWPIDISVL